MPVSQKQVLIVLSHQLLLNAALPREKLTNKHLLCVRHCSEWWRDSLEHTNKTFSPRDSLFSFSLPFSYPLPHLSICACTHGAIYHHKRVFLCNMDINVRTCLKTCQEARSLLWQEWLTWGGRGRPTKTQNKFLSKSSTPQPVLCPPYTQLAIAVYILLRLRRLLGEIPRSGSQLSFPHFIGDRSRSSLLTW